MNIVISYATNKFKNSQLILNQQSMIHGANLVLDYGPSDLDSDFVNKNINILTIPILLNYL